MARQIQKANLFELSTNRIQVTYSQSSIAGVSLFSYRDENISRQASGKDIRTEETSVGELVTITLEQIPDLRTVTFTLLLPTVNVQAGSAGTHIQVPGIRTTTHTSITGSVLGPEKTYSEVTLKGTAQFVTF